MSQGYLGIALTSIIAFIFSMVGIIPTHVGVSMLISFAILNYILKRFDKDHGIVLDEKTSDEPNERLAEFKRKLAEGQKGSLDAPSAAIVSITDADGNVSQIILYDDGKIKIEGDIDPRIIAATKDLDVAIKVYGVEAISKELQRQIEKFYDEEHKRNKND